MDAYTTIISDKYTSSNSKQIIMKSASDVSKLPTSTTYGSFGITNVDTPCDIGSIAYTADLAYICMLGPDNQWHEV